MAGRLVHTGSPLVTWTLIATCGATFVAELVGGSIQFAILGNGPLPPAAALAAVNGPLVARGEVWRLVTASFVHAGVPHLALNMFGLLLAGIFAERIFGHLRTACIFAAGLLGGNVLAALLSSPGAFTLGASGRSWAFSRRCSWSGSGSAHSRGCSTSHSQRWPRPSSLDWDTPGSQRPGTSGEPWEVWQRRWPSVRRPGGWSGRAPRTRPS
jgi:hypothetical protein